MGKIILFPDIVSERAQSRQNSSCNEMTEERPAAKILIFTGARYSKSVELEAADPAGRRVTLKQFQDRESTLPNSGISRT